MQSIRAAITMAAIACSVNAHAGLFSTGGMDENCLEKYSKAWCTWDAANMSKDTSDIPQKTFRASYEKEGGNIGNLGMALATNQGWLPPTREPLGLGKGFQTGMFLLGFLLQGKRITSISNRVIGWMPIEMAKTEEEAGRKFEELIAKAVAQSMPGYTLTPVVVPFNQDQYKSINGIFGTGWKVTGKDCDAADCRIVKYTSPYVDGEVSVTEATKGEAPAWMGGYKAWVFNFHHSLTLPDLLVGEHEANTHRIAVQLSKALPSWAFISLADQHEESYISKRMINRGLTLPLIVHEGRLHAPIFPEVDIKAPEKTVEGAVNE